MKKFREVFTSLCKLFFPPCVDQDMVPLKAGAHLGVYFARDSACSLFVTLFAPVVFALGSLSPCECIPVSTRPLIMGCSALLSVVSQLLSVCNPADFSQGLQRGATPFCGVPASTRGTLSSRCSSFRGVRKQCPSFRAVRIFAPVRRRFAPSASCSFGSVLRYLHAVPLSIFNPSGILDYSAVLVQTLEHIGVPRKRHAKNRKDKGLPPFRERQSLRPRAGFGTYPPAVRRANGGTKNGVIHALTGFYHNTIVSPFPVV